MPTKRILVSWIGNADSLSAMIDDQEEPDRTRLMGLAKLGGKYGEKPGPLKIAVSQYRFDQIHLLSDYNAGTPPAVHEMVRAMLGPRSIQCTSKRPIDYPSIFKAADSVLSRTQSCDKAPLTLNYAFC